jgi:hypothetical protein
VALTGLAVTLLAGLRRIKGPVWPIPASARRAAVQGLDPGKQSL